MGAAAAGEVARHLDGCRSCRAELAREQELRATLGSLPTVACPSGIGDFVPARAARRPARGRIWGWSLAAAAGVAAVMLGVLYPRDQEPRRTWTEAELAEARHDMITTLSLTADAIDRGRRAAVVEVFGERLPRAVTGSLKLRSPEQGDEG